MNIVSRAAFICLPALLALCIGFDLLRDAWRALLDDDIRHQDFGRR